ncbi:hypothetical protein EZI54_06945 [Marinobacter halodurans]|uniref:YcaO domain-containing protein n=1 Tax=Marinobacter halodurans TaxID=2528979 RepID=A0ABY1ZM90_9GAMM|nr:hypothetical protein [Marinobacter halodurans]TBW57388.1 hypothetical protein EZI54_06945 [Marinobacter halodurans]
MHDTDRSNVLSASGFTNTNVEHHQWAARVVAEARSVFGEAPIDAHIWAYREQGCDYLSCDLSSSGTWLPVTICADGDTYFPDISGGAAEADACDMPDALHIAGLIVRSLDARVTLGRGQNELNDEVVSPPRRPGQTSGPIDLAFNSGGAVDQKADVIFDPHGAKTHPNIAAVEQYLGGIGTLVFDDDTLQFAEHKSFPDTVYSPRLSEEQLETFCQEHLDRYEAYFKENFEAIERGDEKPPIGRFWE